MGTTNQSNSFRTITTRYAATCRRCQQAIPTGTRVRWAQRAGTYHLAAECTTTPATPPEGPYPLEPVEEVAQ